MDYHHEQVEPRSVYDDLEPEELPADLVRDARVQAVAILNQFASSIDMVLSRPNASVSEVAAAFWGPSYALGLNCCNGLSMSERATLIGVERATISKIATNFCRSANVNPSWMMKKQESQEKYRQSRLSVVQRSHNGSEE